MGLRLDGVVSIPESGFCLFGLRLSGSEEDPGAVSIPESGFCLFGPSGQPAAQPTTAVSIPESGFCLFGLEVRLAEVLAPLARFNP